MCEVVFSVAREVYYSCYEIAYISCEIAYILFEFSSYLQILSILFFCSCAKVDLVSAKLLTIVLKFPNNVVKVSYQSYFEVV